MNRYAKDVKTIRNRIVEVGFHWWQADPRQNYRLRIHEKQFYEAQKHIRSKKLIGMGFEQFVDLITPIFANEAVEISGIVLRSTFDHLFDQNSNGTIEHQELEPLLVLLHGFNTHKLTALRENLRQTFSNRPNHLSFKGKPFCPITRKYPSHRYRLLRTDQVRSPTRVIHELDHWREPQGVLLSSSYKIAIETEHYLHYLHDMTAVILGRLDGLALKLVHRFVKQNYNVACQGHPSEDPVARTIEDSYPQGRIKFVSSQLRNSSDADKLTEQIFSHFRHVDVLVMNHQCKRHYRASIEEFPVEKWKEMIDENLYTTFACVKSLWPQMRRQHFGRIVHIANEHSLVASEYQSACTTSHHALLGLSQALAIEGAPYGITSNVICPGHTHINALEQYHGVTTLTDLVLFLCTDQARTINGQTVFWNHSME